MVLISNLFKSKYEKLYKEFIQLGVTIEFPDPKQEELSILEVALKVFKEARSKQILLTNKIERYKGAQRVYAMFVPNTSRGTMQLNAILLKNKTTTLGPNYTIDKNIGQTIWHELGHLHHLHLNRSTYSVQFQFSSEVSKKIRNAVSGYASTNTSEFVAEVFSGLNGPVKKPFDKFVLDLYRFILDNFSSEVERHLAKFETNTQNRLITIKPVITKAPPKFTLENLLEVLAKAGYKKPNRDVPNELGIFVDPLVQLQTINKIKEIIKEYNFKNNDQFSIDIKVVVVSREVKYTVRVRPNKLDILSLKNLLVRMGYNNIQNIPPFEKPEGMNVIMKAADIKMFSTKIAPYITQYKPSYGRLPNDGSSFIEIYGIKVFAVSEENKEVHPKLKGAGKENEQNFYNIIVEHLNQYGSIGINFQSKGKPTITIKSVINISDTSKDVGESKKADMVLTTIRGQQFRVSLKQNEASFWETPDTYFGTTVRKLFVYAIMHGLTTLENVATPLDEKETTTGPNKRITVPIAIRAEHEEAKHVIFGNDLLGLGAVIRQTWHANNYDWDLMNNTLTLECTDIIQTMNDVKEEEWPYFQIRNHKEKRSIHLKVKGLALSADSKKSLSSTTVILPPSARL